MQSGPGVTIDSVMRDSYLVLMPGFLQRPLRYRYYNATIFLIAVNVIAFVVTWLAPRAGVYLALIPAYVVQGGAWWQVVTYMFVHGGFQHIFFNMLALFLFGIQLEQRMGSTEFLLYYFFSGVGAGLATVLVNNATGIGGVPVVGASGAIFGLLLAYAMYFPDRPIYMYFLFAVPAKYFVMIVAALSFFFSNTAWPAHIGGLAGGYLVLKFGRARPLAELKYRYFKWKMNRLRRKFDLHQGGKAKDWDRRVH